MSQQYTEMEREQALRCIAQDIRQVKLFSILIKSLNF